MAQIKDLIKKTFRRLGFDLHRIAPGSNQSLQLVKALNRFDIDLVLDVGANIGQFATELRVFGFGGDIVSFEPLTSAHFVLSSAAMREDSWKVHPRCAIGDYDGESEINVSGNSVSSSLLPMLKAHSSAASDSAYTQSERVQVLKLDSIDSSYFKEARQIFLKIDTQGFESKVLDGAKKTIPNIKGIICELSIVPLYEGQYLWREMFRQIEDLGFTLWSIQPGFVDARDGRTLQIDAIFFRL